ncbi:MAG: rhodanese-like domain-containing protein [Thermoanaerobaculia bacterium]|nr:rhodanese-like domain-containing protein [Thermoanaerobaculia bacterium]
MGIGLRGRRFLVVLAAAVVAVTTALGWLIASQRAADPVDRLAFIKNRVRLQFPSAPQLSTEALARRLDVGEEIVLLDVREPEEYAVSHLPGAVRVDPGAHPALPEGVDSSLPVVAYCSVGWRSSHWVEGLRSQGIDAMNLEGSIFQWVAEDRPLKRDEETVYVVHPYSRAWSWLVNPEDRAFAPH